jgi:hypothetical protein
VANIESPFDLNRYLKASGATKPDLFDWSDPGPALDDDALYCLGYMMDIESHTIIYLRELLSTAVVREPDITAFLACWAYEEFFHSETLKRFLASQNVTIDDRRFADLRRQPPSDRIITALARFVSPMTRHFPAVHMTWGAINELSTLTGYQAMIRRTRHPLLTTILNRIIKDERRHFAFYFGQARRRLEPRAARLMTSFLLRRFWAPVGSPVRGVAAADRVCGYLFSDPEGVASLQALDTVIAGLPGLEWFNLASRHCTGASAPAAAADRALRFGSSDLQTWQNSPTI